MGKLKFASSSLEVQDIRESLRRLSEKEIKGEKKVLPVTPILELLSIYDPGVDDCDRRTAKFIEWEVDYNLFQPRNRIFYSRLVSSLVQNSDNVIDMGSHHGMVCHYCSHFTKGRIVAVECFLESWKTSVNLARGCREISNNRNLFSNVFHLFGAASFDENATRRLWVSNKKSVSNSLHRDLVKTPWFSSGLEVPSYSFVDLFELHSPDFLKMNIEGEDILIIREMLNSKLVPSSLHTIIFEINLCEVDVKLFESMLDCFGSVIGAKFNLGRGLPFEVFSINNFSDLLEQSPHHLILTKRNAKEIICKIISSRDAYLQKWQFD